MKRFVISFFVMLHLSSFSQTVADPAYANMQRAVGGILANATASAGYSATSPQTYSTLYGVGKVALAGVATAGAGLLVAGTAPAWGTVLGVAAISGAVSYGVGLGLDSAVKWAFGTPAATPVTTTTATSSSVQTIGPVVIKGVGATSWSADSEALNGFGAPFQYFSQNIGDANWYSFFSQSTKNNTNPNPTLFTVGSYMVWNITSGPQVGVAYWIWRSPTTHSTVIPACPSGYTQSGISCVATTVVLSNVVLANQTLQQATAALTSAQLSQQANSDAMALMLNSLWQKAAADPAYAGAPYVATKPITAADVQVWMDANPTIKPKVSDFVAPITDTSKGFAPSLPTPANQPVAPVVTPTAPVLAGPVVPSPVTITTPVTVDFGADPHTAAPTLDAPDWLQPLLNMLPGWRTASFTAQGSCYQPSFDLRPVIPKVVVMTSHCDLLEAQRATFSAVMSVAWVMVAAFIILRA